MRPGKPQASRKEICRTSTTDMESEQISKRGTAAEKDTAVFPRVEWSRDRRATAIPCGKGVMIPPEYDLSRLRQSHTILPFSLAGTEPSCNRSREHMLIRC